MPIPTQSEILAGIDNFATHPSSSASLVTLAESKRRNTIVRINQLLHLPDANLTVGHVGEAVAWLRKNWHLLTLAQRAAVQARATELRTSAAAQLDVKLYLVQVFRRHGDLGPSEIEALNSLKVVLDDDPANVGTAEFEQLLEQAEPVFDMLLP